MGELIYQPQLSFDASVGIKRSTLNDIANGKLEDESSMDVDSEKKPMKLRPSSYLVGQQLQEAIDAGEDLEISWPWHEGQIQNWIGAEALWKHALKQLLDNPRAATALVLVTIPHGLSKTDLERITQIFFERFNVPVFSMVERPILGLYAVGATSGLFIELGWDSTDLVPVVETIPQTFSSTHWKFGIKDLVIYLANLLKNDSYLLNHEKLKNLNENEQYDALLEISQKLFEHPKALSLVPEEKEDKKKKGEEFDIASALVNGQEKNLIEEKNAKENNPAAAHDRFDLEWHGENISIGKIRHRFWEPLFNVELLNGLKGIDENATKINLSEAIINTVEQCEFEFKPRIYNGMMLAGPLAGVNGFSQLIIPHVAPYLPKGEVSEFQASSSTLRVLRVPDYFAEFKGREDLNTYLGASIVAKVSLNLSIDKKK